MSEHIHQTINKLNHCVHCGKPMSELAATAGSAITDTDRINWLEARPLSAEVKGGLDDGHAAKFWGISSYSGTLRETIDHMIRTGSERQKEVEQ